MKRFLAVALVLSIVGVSNQSLAEQSLDLDEYVIHYNALSTTLIPIQMAQAYSIQRSSNRAMLNITVLKKVENAPGIPVDADVKASAVNLSGQRRNI